MASGAPAGWPRLRTLACVCMDAVYVFLDANSRACFVACFFITLPILVGSLVDAGRSGHGVVAACGGGVLAATGRSGDGRIPRRERKPPGNSRELHS